MIAYVHRLAYIVTVEIGKLVQWA